MLRSLYSGVSGMKTHQTRMDVIGNNIANVNTTGFKASRVNFSDMLNQTIRGAIAPGEGGAGSNPIQVGLGVKVGAIDTLYTQGGLQSTDRMTDFAIQGNGFFIVEAASDPTSYFTRDGSFSIDDEGYLLHTATGKRVQGVQGPDATMDGNVVQDLTDINMLAPYDGDPEIPLVTFSVSRDGEVIGVYENGLEQQIGILGIASFANLEGLYKRGDNLYDKSLTTGEPVLNNSSVYTVETGFLEMSNVELTNEFTNMIVTQRGYQANSRVITTSDTMLEELLALKR